MKPNNPGITPRMLVKTEMACRRRAATRVSGPAHADPDRALARSRPAAGQEEHVIDQVHREREPEIRQEIAGVQLIREVAGEVLHRARVVTLGGVHEVVPPRSHRLPDQPAAKDPRDHAGQQRVEDRGADPLPVARQGDAIGRHGARVWRCLLPLLLRLPWLLPRPLLTRLLPRPLLTRLLTRPLLLTAARGGRAGLRGSPAIGVSGLLPDGRLRSRLTPWRRGGRRDDRGGGRLPGPAGGDVRGPYDAIEVAQLVGLMRVVVPAR